MPFFKSLYNSRRAYLIIGFFACSIFQGYSQNIKVSDSLERELKKGNYDKAGELELLRLISSEETDYDKQLTYSLQLIVLAKELKDTESEFSGYLQKGNAYQAKGDLTKALESYFDASKIAKDNKYIDREADVDLAIAGTYSIMGDTDSSFQYYRESLRILDSINEPLSLASAQLNFGDELLLVKELDSALYYFNKSNKIFKGLDDKDTSEFGQALNLGNIGLVYAEKGDNEKAEENINRAIEVLNDFGDYPSVCVYLSAMSDVYTEKGQSRKAVDYAKQSLDLALKHGLKDEIGQGYLKLSKLYENRGNINKAYDAYKNAIEYRDSVTNITEFQRQNKMRTDDAVYDEVVARQAQEKVNNQQKIIIGLVVLGLLIIGFLAVKFLKQSKVLEKQKGVIEYEKQRSEELLTNILPEETAEELKKHGSVKAKKFDNVSVLFTDFKGFTSQASLLSPEDLVKSIDYYFSKFDEIVEKYKLEKIKTIGDAYMCAGGLPHHIDHQAAKVAQAGLEIADFVKQTKRNLDHTLAKFDIRVGIHTGPVVAGVVGTKKFQYDIWGDAVNIAARMESSSDVGKVNVSENTYKLLKEYDMFELTSRGALEAKGKGKIEMYFVDYKD